MAGVLRDRHSDDCDARHLDSPNIQPWNTMFALNAAPTTGHLDTIDNAQHPSSARFHCTCGSCPECSSTSVLPLIVTLSDGETNPTVTAASGADASPHDEHRHTSKRGAIAIETSVAASSAPTPALAHTNPLQTRVGSGLATRSRREPAKRIPKPTITAAAMNAAVLKFESIAGQMPLAQATPEVVQAFVDGLRLEGKREPVVLRYLWTLATVTRLVGAFEYSGAAGYNPFAAAAEALALPTQPLAHVFALNKLQTLLSSPRYLSKKGSVELHAAARFWVPLLCLFTYGRPKELMRLQVSDLERHKDAWVLRVSSTMQLDPQTGAPLMRWVPLHEELVRCGFVSYVARRKLDGQDSLFGGSSEATTRPVKDIDVSFWFSGLGRELGLGKGCHLLALRRIFIDACIRSGVTDEGIRLLAGRAVEVPSTWRQPHSSLSHTDALDQAVAWVRRLRIEGLELSHLHATDPLTCVSDAYPDSTTP